MIYYIVNETNWYMVLTAVFCPAPTLPKNSFVMDVLVNYMLDTILVVLCDEGFVIQEGVVSTIIKCTKLGSWLPDPMSIQCNREFNACVALTYH